MVSELAQQVRMRDQVFISYSHKDAEWMERFCTQLNAIGQTHRLKTWTDHQIEPGQDWRAEIEDAMGRASVALLLTSADSLASEFIQKQEVPKLLKKHQDEGLFLYWVPLKHAPYELSSLASIQTAGGINPKEPLASLKDWEQDRVMSAIAVEIGQKLGQSVRMAGDARQSLVEQVRQRLLEIGVEILEEIGCGDTSIVFKGRQGFREYAVKVLVNGGVSAAERKDLKARLQTIANLDDPAYIKMRDALLEPDREPICVISEYIRDARPLDHVLNQCRGLPPYDVILYVRQLARALKEAHDHSLCRRKLVPSNIFIEKPLREGSRARLSPIVFLSETHSLRLGHGTFYSTKESLNYLVPEHYYGESLNEKTDQYALGLIALTMLQGGPPVAVNHMDDLAKLPEFFENPRKFFDKTWLDQAPGLSGVIARMLCKDPGKRWDSMAAVLDAIEPLQRSQRGQEVHVADAKQSYCRYCRGRPEFYRAFYTMFFRRSPATEGLFAKVSMTRQYDMIDEAIEKLLNFRDRAEPTTLSRTREAHRRFQLAPADFDNFRDAFLEALEAMGERDQEVLDSWYAVMRPGLDYMKDVCAPKHQAKLMRVRKSSPKANGASLPRPPLPQAAADGAKAHG
jgi:serine/threonine protein kinase